LCCFIPNCDLLSFEFVLRIWDVGTGMIVEEMQPEAGSEFDKETMPIERENWMLADLNGV
jgi:hypothetical protein